MNKKPWMKLLLSMVLLVVLMITLLLPVGASALRTEEEQTTAQGEAAMAESKDVQPTQATRAPALRAGFGSIAVNCYLIDEAGNNIGHDGLPLADQSQKTIIKGGFGDMCGRISAPEAKV